MNEPSKKSAASVKKPVGSGNKEASPKVDTTVSDTVTGTTADHVKAKGQEPTHAPLPQQVDTKEEIAAVSNESTGALAEATHPHEEPQQPNKQDLQKILKKHIVLTGAAGLIPAPIVDLASITAIQANMIKEIANHFGVEFKENLCRNIIGALVTGTGIVSLGTAAASSLMKSIPLLGTFGGILTMPIIAGASTYALGKVFIEHFENGGTLLDFRPETVKEQFKKEYQEGKKVAANLKDEILQTHKRKEVPAPVEPAQPPVESAQQ